MNNNKLNPIFSKYLAWELVNVLGKQYTSKRSVNGKETYYFPDEPEINGYVTCYRYLANKNKKDREQAIELFRAATTNADYPQGTNYVSMSMRIQAKLRTYKRFRTFQRISR